MANTWKTCKSHVGVLGCSRNWNRPRTQNSYNFQEIICFGQTKCIESHTWPIMWQTRGKHVSKSHAYFKFWVSLVAVEIRTGLKHKNESKFMHVHRKFLGYTPNLVCYRQSHRSMKCDFYLLINKIKNFSLVVFLNPFHNFWLNNTGTSLLIKFQIEIVS